MVAATSEKANLLWQYAERHFDWITIAAIVHESAILRSRDPRATAWMCRAAHREYCRCRSALTIRMAA
eukprot:scaffold256449_cov28-Tisochrysis_lutea.AAC.4